MPKRVIDGEAMWNSDKIGRVEPDWVRVEFAWLLPIAGSNGVFELNPRQLWARCYACNRPDKTVEDVQIIISSFEHAKLLFRWEQDGKRWGYWVGSDKPGRLPRVSWQERYGRIGPQPPADLLARFLGTEVKSLALVKRASGTDQPCQKDGNTVACLGLGLGEESGSDKGVGGSPPKVESTPGNGQNLSGVNPKPELLLQIYEEERKGLPAVSDFTVDRRRMCSNRLKKHRNEIDRFLADFRAAVRKAAETPFLCGQGEKGWVADFDWFVKNDTNYRRVLEGRYDNSNPKTSSSQMHRSRNLPSHPDYSALEKNS